MSPTDQTESRESQRIQSLLEERQTLEGWLERLESQKASASSAVFERVRSDYRNRLSSCLESLREHTSQLSAGLEDAMVDLERARTDHSQVADSLEEGHLRFTIGEIPDSDWSSRRAELESESGEARGRIEAAEAQIAHYRKLLEELSGPAEEDASEPSEGEPDRTQLFDFAEPDPEEQTREFPDPPAGKPGPAFLSDLDRAIDQALDVDDSESEEEDRSLTAPKPGLKCPDCGYTNDADAWFCGVCGADIG